MEYSRVFELFSLMEKRNPKVKNLSSLVSEAIFQVDKAGNTVCVLLAKDTVLSTGFSKLFKGAWKPRRNSDGSLYDMVYIKADEYNQDKGETIALAKAIRNWCDKH